MYGPSWTDGEMAGCLATVVVGVVLAVVGAAVSIRWLWQHVDVRWLS